MRTLRLLIVIGVAALSPVLAGSAADAATASPVDIDLTPDETGIWITYDDGTVESRGSDTVHHGNTPPLSPGEVAVALAPTSVSGYWVFTSRGNVYAFGDARYFGGVGHLTLSASVIAAVPTTTGLGYFMLGADGGIFAFGDAVYRGSLPELGVTPNSPVVSMSATSGGYLLVAEDGGTFAFGNAGFHGSLPGMGIAPASPIIDVVPGTAGYLMLGTDGGIFNFGQSGFHGALVGFTSSPGISVAVKADLSGYVILTADAIVWPFGQAHSAGATLFSGTGDGLFDLAVPDRAVLRATHTSPDGSFRVWALDAEGSVEDLVVNSGGPSVGRYWLNAPATVSFRVEAQGPWTVEVSPVSYATKWLFGMGPLSGNGSDVIMIPTTGTRTLVADADGGTSNQIWHHRGTFMLTRSLLVNETGAFDAVSDTIAGTPDPTYLEVIMDTIVGWAMAIF